MADKKKTLLVSGYLENVSVQAFDEYGRELSELIGNLRPKVWGSPSSPPGQQSGVTSVDGPPGPEDCRRPDRSIQDGYCSRAF